MTYTGLELPVWLNIGIFTILTVIFLGSSVILLASVRKIVWNYKPVGGARRMQYFHVIVSVILILTAVIVLAIILNMIFLNNYNLIFVRIQTYVSHISPL